MADFDSGKPSIARVYDYALGGKDNFAADRELASRLMTIAPVIVLAVRENKQFLSQAVAWAARQGIDQFIDLGCGMPTAPGTHETARAERPGARVAYVDNDPVVVSHLNARLAPLPGITAVDGDLRDADAILDAIGGGIDLTRPAALMMGMVLHFIELQAGIGLVKRYVAALAPGSYVVLSVAVFDASPEADKINQLYSAGPSQVHRHTAADVGSFFGGLDLVPPGIADARSWRPGWDTVPETPHRVVTVYGGVARIPG